MPSNDNVSSGTEREWKYSEGDVIREEHEQFAPGGVALGKSEYRIKRLLRDESDGKRFYHVEKEEGGSHLYSAKAIEHSYEIIPVSESGAWTQETGTERNLVKFKSQSETVRAFVN